MRPGLMMLFSLLFIQFGFAQNGEIIPFDSDRWAFVGEAPTFTTYKGKDAMRFDGDFSAAYLKDSQLENGIIEFDIAFAEERNFVGFAFRMEDTENYEDFYFRPHQSGNPDANQYTPVYNSLAGWQLYHGEKFSTRVSYIFDTWQHVKCVIQGDRAEIFLEDMDKPLLYVPDLKRTIQSGMVGVWGRKGWFANYRYTATNEVSLQNAPLPAPEKVEGVVSRWAVGLPALAESELEGKSTLPKELVSKREWVNQPAEPGGRTNLAAQSATSEEANTLLTRLIIDADQATIKALDFGYSDRVKVYCNGQLLYSGNNGFRSRDYRYLGTIGYFDTVHLPLKKGENELIIAVSESFGGWGLQAKFQDDSGIAIR